jgi:Raf kinase inhibitor-like YbhB/YbcL family protein
VETVLKSIRLWCPTFNDGERVGLEHTRDRANLSPALHWAGLPEETRSLVVTCEDLNAPGREPSLHWMIYNIPPQASPGRPPVGGLPCGVSREVQPHEVPGAWQAVNDFGEVGYTGPGSASESGVHCYLFQIHALDILLTPREGMTNDELRQAIKGHVLGTGTLIGTHRS